MASLVKHGYRNDGPCRICGAPEVEVFAEIPSVPVHCNILWRTREAAVNAPRGDVHLGFCKKCGHIFNVAFDPRRMDYSREYENALHFSATFDQYARSLAVHLVDRYDLRGKQILEIGCGDGHFLRLLCDLGENRGVGFDPSFNGTDTMQSDGKIRIIADYYCERYADQAADFICCRHVLEHVDQPYDFLLQLRRGLAGRQGTAVFFEVPNVLYTLRDLGIWDIIYEHCSYFSAQSVARLMVETGFFPQDVYAAYGDQFLCVEAAIEESTSRNGSILPDAVDELERLVKHFGGQYRAKVDLWSRNLQRFLAEGRRIVVWGAGSKGVTLLNTVPGCERVDAVIDINPTKQGSYVPGTGQRIIAPEDLPDSPPDIVLVMNPLYEREIEQHLADLGVLPTVLTV